MVVVRFPFLRRGQSARVVAKKTIRDDRQGRSSTCSFLLPNGSFYNKQSFSCDRAILFHASGVVAGLILCLTCYLLAACPPQPGRGGGSIREGDLRQANGHVPRGKHAAGAFLGATAAATFFDEDRPGATGVILPPASYHHHHGSLRDFVQPQGTYMAVRCIAPSSFLVLRVIQNAFSF